MSGLGRAILRPDLRWNRVVRLAFLRRLFRLLWRHVIACSSCSAVAAAIAAADDDHPLQYRRLQEEEEASMDAPRPLSPPLRSAATADEDSEDLVSLKVSLLGDCRIGKTSFMTKYVGEEEEHSCLQMNGLNLMDKVFIVRGVRIAFSIWDVGGDRRFLDYIPLACKDAAAILIMFDLTNRSSLNNTTNWYRRARNCNKTGIPILIGTKFDDFVQLPLDMQWTIVNEDSRPVFVCVRPPPDTGFRHLRLRSPSRCISRVSAHHTSLTLRSRRRLPHRARYPSAASFPSPARRRR